MVVRYWGNKIACNIVIIFCSSVLKMLFIKVWLRLINLMLRRRLVEYMMSRKSKTFLFQSHFRRSILKSPSNITFLLSLINFSERGFGYSSLNSLCCIHGCLYIYSIFASYYIQCFWSPFGLFHLLDSTTQGIEIICHIIGCVWLFCCSSCKLMHMLYLIHTVVFVVVLRKLFKDYYQGRVGCNWSLSVTFSISTYSVLVSTYSVLISLF